MSSEALAWAIRCKVPKASLKNMLMVVSDLANHVSGDVFASLAYYQEITGLSKRTVLECLDDLVELGVLGPTSERRGSTRQIVVYHFNMVDLPQVPRWSSRKSGAKAHPLSEQVQKRPERGAVSTAEEVQKRTTEPSSMNQEEEDSPPTPNGVVTPTVDLFGNPEPEEEPEALEDQVTRLWHTLKADEPGIADVDVLNPSRLKRLSARANEIAAARRKRGAPTTPEDVWDEIFGRIRASTFLCGRAPPGKGRTGPFKLTIDFVLRPAEFGKILEGAYDDDERYRDNTGFDARNGREYGSAEQAVRGALDRLGSSRQFRTGGGNPRGADGRGPGGAASGTRALPGRAGAGGER